MSSELSRIAKEIMQDHHGPDAAFVQTSPCGRGQWHPGGLVGNLFRINDPATVNAGYWVKDQLELGQLWLCVRHSGDCFQDYVLVIEDDDGLAKVDQPVSQCGAYGMGNATKYELDKDSFATLLKGGSVALPD